MGQHPADLNGSDAVTGWPTPNAMRYLGHGTQLMSDVGNGFLGNIVAKSCEMVDRWTSQIPRSQ